MVIGSISVGATRHPRVRNAYTHGRAHVAFLSLAGLAPPSGVGGIGRPAGDGEPRPQLGEFLAGHADLESAGGDRSISRTPPTLR
jgi:hypothetical protein